MKKLFWLDDRTGLPSTSKLIRWLSFFLACLFVFSALSFIFLRWIKLTQEEVQIMNIVKDFLIFFIPTIEGSYQFNRKSKLTSGNAPLVTDKDKIVREEI
jgi:hypothetical protein